jgi:hypothetical protein
VVKGNPGRWRIAIVATGVAALAVYAVVLSAINEGSRSETDQARREGAPTRSIRPGRQGRAAVAKRFRTRLEQLTSDRIKRAENHSYLGRSHQEVERAVARFVPVYLRYEVSGSPSRQFGALKALATPHLVEALVRSPARIPNGVRPPREHFIRAAGIRPMISPSGRAFGASAVIRRNGRLAILGLTVVGRRGSLRIARVGR